ncbi:RecF/RecN/SMC N terminal domain-containing protein [Desarmillaria tabescens]|uniref:Structural maintenance of chromosomes protein 4 n=1 Tax=Armillaria tabescens TaxID=1929756 RepID=A0AA39NHW3_ARMTA|nr:RecF/RecN/SMC N terminal domain-containing protein [Desarmillaria tabescens]KAK0465948.1 RecF/RecN/SMC N terminal domain-containing protein [Desarmillaria tabescens]
MPPRRSSRTRASVEPVAKAEPAPLKRKRPAEVINVDAEEKENQSSRSRRSTSARPSTKSRASTRTRTSLQEVPETDDERNDSDTPPVKKARPSLEHSSGEESEEEQPKRKGRAGAGLAKKSDNAKMEVDGHSQPTRRTTRGSSAKPPSRVSTRVSRSRASESVAADSEEEDVKPIVKATRKSTKPASRQSRRATHVHEEHDDERAMDSSVEDAPEDHSRRSAGNPSSSRRSSKPTVEDIAEEEEEEEVVKPARVRSPTPPQQIEVEEDTAEKPSSSRPPSVHVETRVPEAEGSLLDQISRAPPASRAPATQLEEPQGPQTRLVIHKMALVNFKSYAGRQEIGPFHKSFSSIVGPNGSGKSNTIDALLFVFGYRATKMRQGKLSELIHNSDRYPDLDECSVEVHFRDIIDLPGPDDYEVVPNTDLVVSRQAFKTNNSIYKINGRASNFKEVQSLLKGRGIDLDHNRFLILQGEVESIAQMKPKGTEHEEGLLEYLEDIIGTSKYKEGIDEALQKVDDLQEQRSDKMNRLRIVEKEKNSLDEKRKEAIAWKKLINEHIRAESRLWQWYLAQAFGKEGALRAEMDKCDAAVLAETERNANDRKHLDQLQTHYKEREAAYAEVQKAAAAANQDLQDHEKREIGLKERRKHASTKLKKVTKTISEETAAKTAASRAIEDSTQKMKKEKSSVEKYEASLLEEEKVLESITEGLKDKTQVFHDQIETKQKELQPWMTKLNAKQAEIDVATSERDALVQKAERIKDLSKDAEQSLAELRTDQTAKVQEQGQLRQRKAQAQNELRAAEKRYQDAQANVQSCRAKAMSTRQKVDEAKSSQAESRTQSRVLECLTRFSEQGRVQGFHGRLGNLGKIADDKYDVAVTTACGNLNYMVVDKVEQGQACIEHLRSQNAGRTSILVLEKLGKLDMSKKPTPENVPRLFDLITPKDPKFAPAFYKGVGETLVAKDMEQANRIAFGGKRYRVVTLSGQLIDMSGTMGGGGQPARGGMSSKFAAEAVPQNVLKNYERESEEARKQLELATQESREAETERDRLLKVGPEIDLSFEKLGMDIENGKKRIADAEKRVRELKAQSKPDDGDMTRIAKLERDIATYTADLKKLQERSSTIEAAIKELEKRILEIGGAKLLAQRSKVDGIKLHLGLANDEITKAEVAKKKAQNDVARLTASLDTNLVSQKEVEEELENLDAELEEVRAYVANLSAKVAKAKEAEDTMADDLQKLKEELDETLELVQGFIQREAELKHKAQIAKEAFQENEGVIIHWQEKHDELQLEEIDDYDDDDEDDDENEDGDSKADESREGSHQPASNRRSRGHSVKPDPEGGEDGDEDPRTQLHIYSNEELSQFRKRDMVADIQLLEEKLSKPQPNLGVLDDYKAKEEEFFSRASDVELVTQERDKQKAEYDRLRKQRLDEFMAGFNLISLKLKEMYQMITLGGNAELELVDSMDPFSEGIIFSVMPPKKSWKNISNLSGGEKTLSSLALVFALHVFKPTPLYFMDEIDAALDFRNVSIVANYIKDRTKNAQFIIISLRNDMFELSQRLIGIYKTNNATQSISIDNKVLVHQSTA